MTDTPEEQVAKALAEHGRTHWLGYVPMRVVRQVDPKVLGDLIINAGKPANIKRYSKYDEMVEWCNRHIGNEVTAYSLSEMFGFSPPTTRKFINDRPDLFRVAGHGTWIIRDVETERQQDRKP